MPINDDSMNDDDESFTDNNDLKPYDDISVESLIKDNGFLKKSILSLDEANLMLDIILDPTNEAIYKVPQKLNMISVLKCNQLIDISTLQKILGNFRVPSMASKRKTVVCMRIQKALAGWLEKYTYALVWDKNLLKLWSFMFNMLSIGYLRSGLGKMLTYILMISGTIDKNFEWKFILNHYKIDMLISWIQKNPEMLPLATLICHYMRNNKVECPRVDYLKLNALVENRSDVICDYLPLPDDNQIDQRQMQRQYWQLYHLIEAFRIRYQGYESLPPPTKMIRIDNGSTKKTAMIAPSIPTCPTISSLCDALNPPFNDITSIDVLQLLRLFRYFPDQQFKEGNLKGLTSILIMITVNSQSLDSGVCKIVRDSSWSRVGDEVLKLLSYPLELPNTIDASIHKVVKMLPNDESEDTIYYLLSKLPLMKWGSFRSLLRFVEKETNSKTGLIKGLIIMIKNWICQIKMDYTSKSYVAWISVNHVIRHILQLVTSISLDSPNDKNLAKCLIGILSIFYIQPLEMIDIGNIVLPPLLLYSSIFSGNPCTVNVIFKHISFTKKYFGEYGTSYISTRIGGTARQDDVNALYTTMEVQSFKSLHNSYVMDLCNMFWKDKAFHSNVKSNTQGMLLPQSFVRKLLSMEPHFYENRYQPLDLPHSEYDLFYYSPFQQILYETNLKRIKKELSSSKMDGLDVFVGPINKERFDGVVSYMSAHNIHQTANSSLSDYTLYRSVTIASMLHFKQVSSFLFNSFKSLSQTRSKAEEICKLTSSS